MLGCEGFFLYIFLVCGSFSYGLLVCDGFSHELLVYGGFLYRLLLCNGIFMHIVTFRIIFSTKNGYVYVCETFKNEWVLQACLLKSKVYKRKNVPGPSDSHYF